MSDTSGHLDRRIEELETALAAAQAKVEMLLGEYAEACKLVADMHAAAVGEVRGTIRGVVADVADMKADRDRLAREVEHTREVIEWLQAAVTALATGDIQHGSPLHHKLRDVVIAYRAACREPGREGETR